MTGSDSHEPRAVDLSGIESPEGCARILREFAALALRAIEAPGAQADATLRALRTRAEAALRAPRHGTPSLLARLAHAVPDLDRRRHVLRALAAAVVEREHARRIDRRARLAHAHERRLAYEWSLDPERLALLRASSRFERPQGRPETPLGHLRGAVRWAAAPGAEWAPLVADLGRHFLGAAVDPESLRRTAATLAYRRRKS